MAEPASPQLTRDQMRRYARHIALREVGGAGQRRLLAATVRLHGAGPAAEEAARYLAAAGVGRLTLDTALAAALSDELGALNPDCRVVGWDEAAGALDAAVDEEGGPFEPDDRLEGALEAVRLISRLVGVGATEGFRWETPRP